MTDPDDTTLARRHLIRGGAVLAGAAGLTAAGAAMAPRASAANGDPVLAGGSVSATATTAISNASNAATLTLANTTANRPTLKLTARAAYGPNDALPPLQPGEFLCTTEGPYVGVTDGSVTAAGYLINNYDLDTIATPVPESPPKRLLDTRSAAGRDNVVRAASGAINTAGQLVANKWIDVGIRGVDNTETLDAVFCNLTAVTPTGNGYLTVYPPGTRPNVSSVNYAKGAVIANGCFVGVKVYANVYVVRIYTLTTTHVLLDLTGVSAKGPTAALPPNAKVSAKYARRRVPASRRVLRGVARG